MVGLEYDASKHGQSESLAERDARGSLEHTRQAVVPSDLDDPRLNDDNDRCNHDNLERLSGRGHTVHGSRGLYHGVHHLVGGKNERKSRWGV